jgi:hypothetical protein
MGIDVEVPRPIVIAASAWYFCPDSGPLRKMSFTVALRRKAVVVLQILRTADYLPKARPQCN